MNKTAGLLKKFQKYPSGLWLFTKVICLKAPYFSTIRPVFTILEPGQGEARIKKRRAIENHLGTVHAIAIANLCELVAGTTLEISIPKTHRWIPKSMKINYLGKATTDLKARTNIELDKFPDSGSLMVYVEVLDTQDKEVSRAEIEMYISLKK